METEGKVRLADVFVSIQDPRQAKKKRHDLVEMLVVTVRETGRSRQLRRDRDVGARET
jgi:hypothetical protein